MTDSLPRLIKLMPDYECHPLWSLSADEYEIDPSRLPISTELAMALAHWAGVYDGTLNRADPLSSGFPDSASRSRFEQAGQRLWKELQKELGDAVLVAYVSVQEYPLAGSDPGCSVAPPVAETLPSCARPNAWYVFVYDHHTGRTIESYSDHPPERRRQADVTHGPFEPADRVELIQGLQRRFPASRYEVRACNASSIGSAVQYYFGSQHDYDHFFDGSD